MCLRGGSTKPAHIRHVGGDVHEFREEHLEEQLPYERRASLRAFRLVRALEWFVPVLEERPELNICSGEGAGAMAASPLQVRLAADFWGTLGG